MSDSQPAYSLSDDTVLRAIVEGTAGETGERFFEELVRNVAMALGTHGAWVTEYLEQQQRLRALAFWSGDGFVPDYEYEIAGTPCEPVFDQGCLIHIPENVITLFPNDPDLPGMNAVSYMGVPLRDVDGSFLGHLAVLDTKVMPTEPRLESLFSIFAARAAAEMRRLRAEAEVRDSAEKLSRLVNGAMDAIVEVDRTLRVTQVNPAAESLFGYSSDDMIGGDFGRLLAGEGRATLARLIEDLASPRAGEHSGWIPGGFAARCANGEQRVLEATLSCFEQREQPYYTLVLRDVNDRIEAERAIRSLSREAEYLREELKKLEGVGEMIGRSPSMLRLLEDIADVAVTDTTVLIQGETGTGKEVVARAIHAASTRHDRPLIKVNCAAIPATLIESEFFGHEKGAFTGATQRRDGRFALADGGTIFLDEVGELPLDLQSKLLRVLQEGEFEPVGSSRTRKVDVRVMAATNRDLSQAVKDREFREDLYYRLNVFPLHVPPLRERGDDVALLAVHFADQLARRTGRSIEPLTPDCIRRLQAYDWPGNVRELQNVIERALITSRDRRLDLERAIPRTALESPGRTSTAEADHVTRVRTVEELQQLERQNILLALEQADWRVSGANGAAELLGMNPSTLNSRMRALRVKRPTAD